ncbi:hypothetical protein KC660_04050 [Candidatus Dojkabacteria bacterium]|uniref:Uncharacterized protein n=1 Tax=Candidatus Dojkabacteria bacterium TaxID=2099670 RepID=A0A955L3Z6_9BACT|nr:hypothetical protein [Candidatus Dojkabacteria bacterium]
MINYLLQSFVLLVPFIIAGGFIFAHYMRIKQASKYKLAVDVVAVRRAGWYVLKFVFVMFVAVGLAFILKVAFAKIFGTPFSYPLLTGSSIQLSEVPFLQTDLVVGLFMFVVGLAGIWFSRRSASKLDSRRDTYLDKIYAVASKMTLVYFAILPLYFAVYEVSIYFLDKRNPAIVAGQSLTQDVNIFQIVDYISTGASQTTTLFQIKGANAPGESLALALALILVVVYLKFVGNRSLAVPAVSVPKKTTTTKTTTKSKK